MGEGMLGSPSSRALVLVVLLVVAGPWFGPKVDEGLIHWDDPVTDHLPDFPFYVPFVTQTVTIGDLLSHRAGVGRLMRGMHRAHNRTSDPGLIGDLQSHGLGFRLGYHEDVRISQHGGATSAHSFSRRGPIPPPTRGRLALRAVDFDQPTTKTIPPSTRLERDDP